jgi:glucose-6-phosphate isomerase
MKGIIVDLENLQVPMGEGGCLEETVADLAKAHPTLHRDFVANARGFPLGWYWLDLEVDLRPIVAQASVLREKFDTMVVLGIGGSALGASALHQTFAAHKPGRGKRVVVLDNVDPTTVAGEVESLDLKRTCFNVISKSGGTTETISQFLVFRDALRKAVRAWKEHFVITTDPDKSFLLRLANEEGLVHLPVPASVGGRFSVLSAVGLLPAAFDGIDAAALVDGALLFRNANASDSPETNVALRTALSIHALTVAGQKRIVVLMPYSDRLRLWADWFAQIWAESLGKRLDLEGRQVFAGTTALKCLGVTDQHSQLQLFAEGPRDKVIFFVGVDEHEAAVPIPMEPAFSADFGYLEGRSMRDLINAEREGTQRSLSEAGVPTALIRLSRIDERSVGEFIMFWELVVGYMGVLTNVNTFDQPGVEASKAATKKILEEMKR